MSDSQRNLEAMRSERKSNKKPSDSEIAQKIKDICHPTYEMLFELAAKQKIATEECLKYQRQLNECKQVADARAIAIMVQNEFDKYQNELRQQQDAQLQAQQQAMMQQQAQQAALLQQQQAAQLLHVAKEKFARGVALTADESVALANDLASQEPELMCELDEICEFCEIRKKNKHHDKWCSACIRFHEDRARSAKVNALKRQQIADRNKKIKILKTAQTIQKTRNGGNR